VLINEIIDYLPVILDPLTRKNVAKSSFRIEDVKESFTVAHTYLNEQKLKFDKNDLKHSNNLIFEMYKSLDNNNSENLI